jgi:cytochrome d ubiquinol oxidase subunit II
LSPVPIAVAVASLLLYRGIRGRAEVSPFILSMVLFLLGYAGLAISLWPNLIPPHVSIWEAAAPPETLSFMIAGFVVLIPIILAYTGYSYWVFRGKVADATGYH